MGSQKSVQKLDMIFSTPLAFPSSWLLERRRVCNLSKLLISGIEPVNELYDRFNIRKFWSSPIPSGIEPVKFL